MYNTRKRLTTYTRIGKSFAFIALWLISTIVAPVLFAGTFRDDFEDGDLESWRQLAPPNGPTLWKVVNGELEVARPGQGSTALVTGEATWTDYTIVCDFKLIESHGQGDIHIIARAQELRQLLVFNLGDFCEPDGVCVQRVPDVPMADGKKTDLPALNVWHRLKLEAAGAQFTLSLNGEEVLSYRDETIQTGVVGLGVTKRTVRFDNIEISGPDVPDVTPPTWKPRPVKPRGKLAKVWGEIKRN